MKAERWIFVFLSIFFLVVVPIYWFMSREVIGTFALLMTFALCAMLAVYLSIQSNKLDARPEDRKDGEIIEGAGEMGFFPSRSIWPFCLRCRFSWLPRRVQGMMGKVRISAQRVRSLSAT